MASRKDNWTFVDGKKEAKKNKKSSKNRKKQRKNEFEIVNNTSSSDEQQYEVIPPPKVRSFESEPLQVREDYYNSSSKSTASANVVEAETDSDIEVISKGDSSLYSDVLVKAAEARQQQVVTDSDEIESGEDVLAMEIDALISADEANKNDDEDLGIEVVVEGCMTSIDKDLLVMEKSGFPKEVKVKPDTPKNRETVDGGEKELDENFNQEACSDVNNVTEEEDEEEENSRTGNGEEEEPIEDEKEGKFEDENTKEDSFDMAASTYGLASLFESTTHANDDEEAPGDIVTIKTTTLILLFCVSIAAGMSVGTGLGSLFAVDSADEHRNMLSRSASEENKFIYEDGEFKATKNTIRQMLTQFRQLENKYNSLKAGYEDYKTRYNLHKTMMWYWRKRAKSYENTAVKFDDSSVKVDNGLMVIYYEGNEIGEETDSETPASMLVNLTQQLKKEKDNSHYWKSKYTSLKLSKLRTCAKIGREMYPGSFSFSNCLLLFSNAIPDLNISSSLLNLTRPVERFSEHVNKAWNDLKNRWKTDTNFKDSAAIKRSLNAKRFRKIFSIGNIVANDDIKTPDDGIKRSDRIIVADDGANGRVFYSEEEYEEYAKGLKTKNEEESKHSKPSILPPSPSKASGKEKNSFINLMKAKGFVCDKNCPNEIPEINRLAPCKNERVDLKKERGTPCDKDCSNEFPEINRLAPCKKERGTPCDKDCSNKYFPKINRPAQCKKEKVDLKEERGTPCDKDCVRDDNIEQMLRSEKDKLQKKLNRMVVMFNLLKTEAKRKLKNTKEEMKENVEENKERRRQRVQRLKKQKFQLKEKIRELKEKAKQKHEAEIQDLENANDELRIQIRKLETEKRYWERIERHNMLRNLEELEETLETEKNKYERKIKELRMKFKRYMQKQEAADAKKAKATNNEKEDRYQVLKLKHAHLQRKLDYYKSKHHSSKVQIQQLQTIVEKAKQLTEHLENKLKNYRKLVRDEKREKVKSSSSYKNYKEWLSYDEEMNKLNLPRRPSVYCPDQMNCMKGDEVKFEEPEEIIRSEDGDNSRSVTFAVTKFENGEEIFVVKTISQDIHPPMSLNSPFFPPKPSPPKIFGTEKPTPPKSLHELEGALNKKSRENSSSVAEEESGELDNKRREEDALQSWYLSWSDHRADSREHDDVYDESNWYMEMMSLRDTYRAEEDERARRYNWYMEAMMNEEDGREN